MPAFYCFLYQCFFTFSYFLAFLWFSRRWSGRRLLSRFLYRILLNRRFDCFLFSWRNHSCFCGTSNLWCRVWFDIICNQLNFWCWFYGNCFLRSSKFILIFFIDFKYHWFVRLHRCYVNFWFLGPCFVYDWLFYAQDVFGIIAWRQHPIYLKSKYIRPFFWNKLNWRFRKLIILFRVTFSINLVLWAYQRFWSFFLCFRFDAR